MVEHFLFIFNFRPLTECLILISHTIPVIMWGTIILISQEPIIHTSLHQYIHPIFFPVRRYGLQIMTPPTKSTVFGKFGNFNIINVQNWYMYQHRGTVTQMGYINMWIKSFKLDLPVSKSDIVYSLFL